MLSMVDGQLVAYMGKEFIMLSLAYVTRLLLTYVQVLCTGQESLHGKQNQACVWAQYRRQRVSILASRSLKRGE